MPNLRVLVTRGLEEEQPMVGLFDNVPSRFVITIFPR